MSASDPSAPQRRLGTVYALAAYTLWGLLPFYWKAMKGFPMWETLAHRALWSLATIVLLLLATRRFGGYVRILRDPFKLRMLGLSALFIAANWSLYVFAMDSNQVLQASLGYYINPLVSIALGVLLLRERLNRLQVAAVLLAGIGVLLLAWEHRGLPWIALGLAGSFSAYGLLKKQVRVDPLAGLGVESLWMAPVALGYLTLVWQRQAPHAFASGLLPTLLLMGTGAITLAPLFFFAGAAQRLPLSTLGFFQYLSPSIQLILAVVFFGEPFRRAHGIAFGFIWAALGLYLWDGWRRRTAARENNTKTEALANVQN